MKVELNESKVRTIATSLRAAIHTGHVTHSKVLEVLAASLGFRNWDTMSGMLKRESRPTLTLAQPVKLYMQVFATCEGDGPDWAQVVIDQVFIDQLLSLQALCDDRRLSHVATFGEPNLWQGDHREEPGADSINFDSTQLYITARGWWFRATPKHTSYACETRVVDIEMLCAALVSKASTAYLAWHSSTVAGEPPVLVSASMGNTQEFVQDLVDDGALSAHYLP